MFLELIDRKIIPRWRDLQTTAALGELDFPLVARPTAFEFQSLTERIQDWNLHPTPWVASDLVSAAFVVGRPEEAAQAAKFIVENERICPPASVSLARRILNPTSEDWALPEVEDESLEILQRRIHGVKKRVTEEPRNSIQWVELARLYTIMGQTERAERAMRIACALSPSNRFVLRAAARLFTHNHAPESALRMLRNAASTRHDPWLLAAEIGVASVAGKPSRFAKTGVALISGKALPDLSVTELASSLATLEMHEGNTKKAKKYFRRSLVRPTENSIAQAEWASKGLGGLEVDVQGFNAPRRFEALAWDSFEKAKWEEAVQWSQKWHWDQPFSARPGILASYITSGALERYEESIRIIKTSLVANPGDAALINNWGFSLANLGKIAEAEMIVTSVEGKNTSAPSSITLVATKGLICFRKGEVERGRQLYLEAMDLATKEGIPSYRARAAIYLAREEILAGTEYAEASLRRAVEESRGQQSLDLIQILNRVMTIAEERHLKGRESTASR